METPDEGRRERGLRPKHFKFLLAINVALVVIVRIAIPDLFAWALAIALLLTIVDVVIIALAQD